MEFKKDSLEERLGALKILAKDLIKYFEVLADLKHKERDAFGKAAKLSDPAQNGLVKTDAVSGDPIQLFAAESGIQKSLLHMASYTRLAQVEAEGLYEYLDKNTIPTLNHLLREIKAMDRDIKQDISTFDKDLNKEKQSMESLLVKIQSGLDIRKSVLDCLDIHAKRLREGVEDNAVIESVEKKPTADPWLQYMQLLNKESQVEDLKRNQSMSAKKRMDLFFAFEANLVENLKKVLLGYISACNKATEQVQHKHASLQNEIEMLDSKKEMQIFMEMNPEYTSNVVFEQIPENSLLKIVKHGPVCLKKTGIFPGSVNYYAILSRTGYLHLFNDEPDFASSLEANQLKSDPQVSICLSECILQPLFGDQVRLEHKGMLTVTTNLFQFSNNQTASQWWHLMVPFVKQALAVELREE